MVGGMVGGAGSAVGGVVVAGAASNDSGQLGIAWAGVSGSSSSEGGGHARIAGSVGGSGGQMSVSSGGAGEASDAGGQVDFMASAATAFGGSLIGATCGASITPAMSAGSPGDVGTVWAHSGVPFLPSPLADVSVLDQSGSPLFSAGATGFDWAQTGLVSRVGTAGTGSSAVASGGAESSDSGGLVSKSQSV
jgi:hypothetical protein